MSRERSRAEPLNCSSRRKEAAAKQLVASLPAKREGVRKFLRSAAQDYIMPHRGFGTRQASAQLADG
ncbi:MAG TPA: hypothetical protein VFY06_11415 [Verrucomicrobiae bacterium]|nr:hypothetical protein [Verrucomicrobiae bacterium]